MKHIFVTALIIISNLLSAQKNDAIWLLGYSANNTPEDSFCVSILDFSNGAPTIQTNDSIAADFKGINATWCNNEGVLQAYFDGATIYNASHSPMVNGTGIIYNDFFSYCPQSAVMLDYPETGQNKLVLIHAHTEYIQSPLYDIAVDKLYYSVIDMEAGNGNGKVILKNKLLLDDTLSYGRVSAVRHGNGRDWWIVVNEYSTNSYYTILLGPQGPVIWAKQAISSNVPPGLGQAVFSPDGKVYATVGSVSDTQGSFLEIYDFDRCTGVLSNHRRHSWINSSQEGFGVTFSRNSRYLYVSAKWNIFQYDMQATDWVNSRTVVAYYDGFESPFATRFFSGQLAPDGRIYVNSVNGVDVLHVIQEPEQPGISCNVTQHSLVLGCYSYLTLPNYPHFNLYDVSGSPCDSLGIDGPVSPVDWPGTSGLAVRLIPNPVTDGQLHLSWERELSDWVNLSLVNALGDRIAQTTLYGSGNNMTWVLPERLPAGIYYLNLVVAGGEKTVLPVVLVQ